MYLLFALSLIVFIFSRLKKTKPHEEPKLQLRLRLVKLDAGYGYEISRNQQPFIKQLIIPGISTQKPFADEAQAKQTGQLVIYKIEHNLTPSISVQELDSMKITR